MGAQDRNAHKDAQFLRKVIAQELFTNVAGTDVDEPLGAMLIPRHNWRLSDLYVSSDNIGVSDVIIKAQAVPYLAAAGSPQLAPAAAVTFAIEEFFHRRTDNLNIDSLRNTAAVVAQAFTDTFTVLDGFWGVVLLLLDGEGASGTNITTKAQAPIMAFATEALALANCPRVLEGFGRLAILTIEAVGADFDGGIDNTDTANSFNTAPQDGHVVTVPVHTEKAAFNAVLGQQLKDASGTSILGGAGAGATVSPASKLGDALVITRKSDGIFTLQSPTGGTVYAEIRPYPAQGEGRGDTSASQTNPQFVPQ